ncbi:MAG: VanZ family protein [bacterium]|nr:VanZ family protein [bacterium]
MCFPTILFSNSRELEKGYSRLGYMKEIFRKFLLYWMPATLWAWVIFYLSSIPSLESGLPGTWDAVLRKGAHVFVYAVLTWLIFRALGSGHAVQYKKAIVWAMFFALFYACSDEFHQHFVPGRHGRARDVAVDAIGIAVVGIFIARKPRVR